MSKSSRRKTSKRKMPTVSDRSSSLSSFTPAAGFSDPYCMLGIVPELRKFVLAQQAANGGSSDEETSAASENKLGFIKRLKSFRKSTIRRAQGREKSGMSPQNYSSLRDKLPAKFIQTTDVKKATLNPVWMEKFRL